VGKTRCGPGAPLPSVEPVTTLDIVPLDAADPAQMAAWHGSYHEAQVFGCPYPMSWMLEEMRAQLLADVPGERMLGFAGYADGQLVTTGTLTLPLMDNQHLAFLEVTTRPEHRNRGHGSAMLERLTVLAGQHGRRTLTAEASTPYDGPADGSGHPNADFLLHRGFTCALGDVLRVLDLPADEALLHRLVDEAAPHHRDYRIRQFAGPVPEDIIEPFGALIGSLITQAPTGSLEISDERFDPARIRADEEVRAASGRRKLTTVALAPDGTAAAYSELVVPGYEPGRVYQWGTLAHPRHRGHRLGQATKAANLLRLQAEHPDRTLLVTYNAEVNRHMIALNQALGFRPVGRLGEYQRQLADG
jgi:GNAT superfamily N-acetyltransferase